MIDKVKMEIAKRVEVDGLDVKLRLSEFHTYKLYTAESESTAQAVMARTVDILGECVRKAVWLVQTVGFTQTEEQALRWYYQEKDLYLNALPQILRDLLEARAEIDRLKRENGDLKAQVIEFEVNQLDRKDLNERRETRRD